MTNGCCLRWHHVAYMGTLCLAVATYDKRLAIHNKSVWTDAPRRHLDFFEADPHVIVSSFFDADSLEGCSGDLLRADANRDRGISSEEFASFIGSRSNGQVTGAFRQLPASLIMLFYAAACSICYSNTKDDSCCVGSKASVPLPSNGRAKPPEYMILLDFLCPNVDDNLKAFVTQPPTIAPKPSNNPTRRPSVDPSTVSPTLAPSRSELSQETEPSAEPAPELSVNPTVVSPMQSPRARLSMVPSRERSAAPTMEQPTMPPTKAPSKLPIETPTPEPTKKPTAVPTMNPSTRPPLVQTNMPTAVFTATPTFLPTKDPTTSPTTFPSGLPTSKPTIHPSNHPTVTSTVQPSSVPSTSPTITPTNDPTAMPITEPPTSNPTLTPSKGPTREPTAAPTSIPTRAPTPLPTRQPFELLCISFAYTLENTTGFTADEIFNEIDNTIKDRLLEATKTVAINILNNTQPKIPNPALNRHLMDNNESHVLGGHALICAVLDYFGSWEEVQLSLSKRSVLPASLKPRKNRNLRRDRRLAFFSDEFPVEITSVLDSMFCVNPTQDCVVVSTTVCVVLEIFDDPEAVRTNLIQGFRESIDGGGFNDVIPR